MKVRLNYIGAYGKIVCANGELYTKIQNDEKHYEECIDLMEAKEKAKLFVKKYPLMSCSIVTEENQEIIITADEYIYNQAWKEENEKNSILFEAYAKKQRRFKYLVITVFIFICVSSFMLLR